MYLVFAFVKKMFLTGYSLIKIIFSAKFFITIKKIDSEQELYILGNGPSLRVNLIRDIEYLRNKYLLCVNAFATTMEYEILKPMYYVLADDLFWQETSSKKTKLIVSNTMEAIIKKTNWPIKLYIPVKAKKSKIFLKQFESNKLISINYYNTNTINGFKNLSFYLYKLNLGMPTTQNVLIPSLMLAINLGYKNIYLLGADHSWHENLLIDENNILCLKDVHFYNANPKHTPILSNNEPVTIYKMFESLAKTFQTYHLINHYAMFRKAKIFNSSEISYIDAFTRIKLTEVKNIHLNKI